MGKKIPYIETKDFTPLVEELMKEISNGDNKKATKLWIELKEEWRLEIRRVIEEVKKQN
jgi:hypothetical protein